MQLKLEGNISLPKNLNEMLASIPPVDKDKHNETSAPALPYISAFVNKVDPVLLCTFFGLYKSRELAPDDFVPKDFTEKRDFNVKIDEVSELLSHLLFCLWVKKNGYPDCCKDQAEYRKKLYAFIGRLLDEHYYRSTIIPFYINEASKEEAGTSSFLHRLTSSANVKLELVDHSPEHLAREFANAQREFMDEVVKPIVNHRPQPINSKLEELLLKNEDQNLEFKASLRYNFEAGKKGIETVDTRLEKSSLQEICAFLNTQGGKLIIGVENKTRKVLGISNDFKTFSEPKNRNKDGFENHLRNIIIEHIQPYIPGLIRISFEPIGNEEICIVDVEKSSVPTFFKDKIGGREVLDLWVRDGNRKGLLDGGEMAEYIKRNWGKPS